MNAKNILSNKGFESLIHGHPWIMTKDIKDLSALPQTTGLWHLGEHWFFNSPMSKIRLRRFGPTTRNWMGDENNSFINTPEDFNSKFRTELIKHLTKTLQQKSNFINLSNEDLCLRWIFSECDLIPGLIVDIFKNKLVCQILTAPIELFWPVLREALNESYFNVFGKEAQIIVLQNASVREKEGLKVIPSPQIEAEWIKWNGLEWLMTPAGDQKTGAYFDQRDNHTLALKWFNKLKLNSAWDLCCFEGGFGLHIAKSGKPVTFIDQSEKALAKVLENSKKNEIPAELVKIENQDVFSFLRTQFDNNNKVDCIILDPPSFVKSAAEISSAMKGYKELNLRALHCINDGGILISCACSQNVTKDLYFKMLQSAAHDARKSVHILEMKGASPDHSPLLGFPESDYLQAWYLLVN